MAFDARVYWVWLQNALGAGSSKQNRILQGFETLYDFHQAGEYQWRLEGYFTDRELECLREETPEAAAALVEYCEKLGQHIVTLADEDYPALLREIHNPPCALYVKGVLPNFEEQPSVSIVGTRHATSSGVTTAGTLAYGLAKAGAVVVSGGALGIDTAAHKGALRGGGQTVCVLGCGIDYHYLMSNATLRDSITHCGAVISEYPPHTPPRSTHFPVRNRIISGLTVGTLVVEAASKSGSLITAQDALTQNRDVFAVPCGITSPVSHGVNSLLKQGAKPVTCARDILEEYFNRFPGRIHLNDLEETVICVPEVLPEEQKTMPELPEELSSDALTIYHALVKVPQHSSALSQKTGIPASRLLAALTELELYGLAGSHSGQRYSIG